MNLISFLSSEIRFKEKNWSGNDKEVKLISEIWGLDATSKFFDGVGVEKKFKVGKIQKSFEPFDTNSKFFFDGGGVQKKVQSW